MALENLKRILKKHLTSLKIYVIMYIEEEKKGEMTNGKL